MNQPARPPDAGQMPVTRWTVIAQLHSRDEKMVRRALDDLCAQYHYPLYCYIRLRGLSHHDAEDALHDFLAKFLRLDSFQTADESKGKLRTFLLVSLKRFLTNWTRQHSHSEETSLESGIYNENLEHYQKERFSNEDSPDRIFERKWAQDLLIGALQRVREKYALIGKEHVFDVLRPVLCGSGSLRGEDGVAMAHSLGLSSGALRVALNRLLRDYREMLESDIAQTVFDRDKVSEEIAYLKQAFAK
jgi:RNA polymerase sigma-70 factor (ECF subfamily)